MKPSILITGHRGLVGTALTLCLSDRGYLVRGLDLRAQLRDGHGDVRDADAVQRAMHGTTGVVHLAAVSRVVWGERDPAACWSTNVDGTRTVLSAACASTCAPWVIYASSREVYGQPRRLPADEDCPLEPVNIYGRSKVAGERLTLEARKRGLRTAIVRLSNVYGSADDYPDRVVPAFIRGASAGGELRVEGAEHLFDFTHVEDVARGVADLAGLLAGTDSPVPPMHLVTGRPMSLGELATCAIELSGTLARAIDAPARSFDVARFCGDPARAHALLGWSPRIPLRDGLALLLEAVRAEQAGAA